MIFTSSVVAGMVTTGRIGLGQRPKSWEGNISHWKPPLTITIPHFLIPRAAPSVTDHGDYNRSLASPDVALQMEDLLPGTKYELSLSDGHGQRWPEQRGLQMRVAVAIMPGLLVAVSATGRNQLIQDGGQIML